MYMNNYDYSNYYQIASERKKGKNPEEIMIQSNTEIIIEKTERMTEGEEHNEERTGRFLPIFFWTD